MRVIDPRLVSATGAQLERRRSALDSGAQRVGWKLGVGDAERIGGSLAVGHLTSATYVAAGGTYAAAAPVALHADAEIAVELGRAVDPDGDEIAADDAIAAYAGALEIVDLGDRDDSPELIVERNVFHRAYSFGPWRDEPPPADTAIELSAGSRVCRATLGRAPLGPRVCAAARVLAAVGQRLEQGDCVIPGALSSSQSTWATA
jgi:2-keto-4-pentenoate hydratase